MKIFQLLIISLLAVSLSSCGMNYDLCRDNASKMSDYDLNHSYHAAAYTVKGLKPPSYQAIEDEMVDRGLIPKLSKDAPKR